MPAKAGPEAQRRWSACRAAAYFVAQPNGRAHCQLVLSAAATGCPAQLWRQGTPTRKRTRPMTQSKMLGFIALAIGIVLLIFAWQGSNAPVDQITEALTGSYSDRTMWFLMGGIAASLGGLFLLVFGGKIK